MNNLRAPKHNRDRGFERALAGRIDAIAYEGDHTEAVIDWKSGKAIYPEAFLQNIAYRHAAAHQGLAAEQGIIVRLPKLFDDPAWEAMAVPETAGGSGRVRETPGRCRRDGRFSAEACRAPRFFVTSNRAA